MSDKIPPPRPGAAPAAPPSPFDIDPNRLDRELLRQPRMSSDAGRFEAEARQKYSQAKARLDMVAARARLNIRATPVAFGLRDKPTADEVEAAVILSDAYQAQEAVLIAAKFELDVAAGDVVAYLDRRKAIEGLIELIALDYHAGRDVTARTAGARAAADEMLKRTRYVPPGE